MVQYDVPAAPQFNSLFFYRLIGLQLCLVVVVDDDAVFWLGNVVYDSYQKSIGRFALFFLTSFYRNDDAIQRSQDGWSRC